MKFLKFVKCEFSIYATDRQTDDIIIMTTAELCNAVNAIATFG